MKERPILFNGLMVKAILSGAKTQTRRVVKGKTCPYGQPGDQLWVRETWAGPLVPGEQWEESENISEFETPNYCEYAADGGPRPEYLDQDEKLRIGWKPSIYMPRWASRITLEITSVTMERLQAISEADAIAEGADPNAWPEEFCKKGQEAREEYQHIWNVIYGHKSWEANPAVWVCKFKRLPNQFEAKGTTK